ncbi:hypothetical protein AAFF_G00049710 [Aldrovandia affinis]|uniref:Uncharacterized protein n=1 Tax=Aldrovandia affinis TaxID=143900 RepID=A0AAD7WEJ3_9TELE|nr:hypothetical protein AAFF_G00049710 [Aldrovandia affinis]
MLNFSTLPVSQAALHELSSGNPQDTSWLTTQSPTAIQWPVGSPRVEGDSSFKPGVPNHRAAAREAWLGFGTQSLKRASRLSSTGLSPGRLTHSEQNEDLPGRRCGPHLTSKRERATAVLSARGDGREHVTNGDRCARFCVARERQHGPLSRALVGPFRRVTQIAGGEGGSSQASGGKSH